MDRDDEEREAAGLAAGVRVEEREEAGLRAGAPADVRLRVGTLDRLAMSREYPWVAGIPGVTAVTRVVPSRPIQGLPGAGQASTTTGMIIGRRRWVWETHRPTTLRIRCWS